MDALFIDWLIDLQSYRINTETKVTVIVQRKMLEVKTGTKLDGMFLERIRSTFLSKP